MCEDCPILIAAALIDFSLLNLLLRVFQGSRTVWGCVLLNSPENLTSLNIKVLLKVHKQHIELLQLPQFFYQNEGSYPQGALGVFLCPLQKGNMGYSSSPSRHLRSFSSPSVVLVRVPPGKNLFQSYCHCWVTSWVTLEEASEFIPKSFGLSVSVLKSRGTDIISQE